MIYIYESNETNLTEISLQYSFKSYIAKNTSRTDIPPHLLQEKRSTYLWGTHSSPTLGEANLSDAAVYKSKSPGRSRF